MPHPKLDEVIRRDPRYAPEAYEFVFAALAYTQKMLGRVPPPVSPPGPGGEINIAPSDPSAARGGVEGSGARDYHVSGPQLLEGIRALALREFGLMARTVFRLWGINRTDDFGEIIFNLVEANLMSKTAEDSRADFHGVYDLDRVLVQDYHIDVKEEVEEGS